MCEKNHITGLKLSSFIVLSFHSCTITHAHAAL